MSSRTQDTVLEYSPITKGGVNRGYSQWLTPRNSHLRRPAWAGRLVQLTSLAAHTEAASAQGHWVTMTYDKTTQVQSLESTDVRRSGQFLFLYMILVHIDARA